MKKNSRCVRYLGLFQLNYEKVKSNASQTTKRSLVNNLDAGSVKIHINRSGN